MQNYNKPHKLKFKITTKQQKMLRQLDGDFDGKANNKSKKADFQKNNKSKEKRDLKILVKRMSVPNVVSGEVTPRKNALQKNLRRNRRKRTQLQL
jgi:phosphoenolpyruvate synthase/pyruvate phosphate dikinase